LSRPRIRAGRSSGTIGVGRAPEPAGALSSVRARHRRRRHGCGSVAAAPAGEAFSQFGARSSAFGAPAVTPAASGRPEVLRDGDLGQLVLGTGDLRGPTPTPLGRQDPAVEEELAAPDAERLPAGER